MKAQLVYCTNESILFQDVKSMWLKLNSYLLEYKLHAFISCISIFDMKNSTIFFNFYSLQSHNKKLKTIKDITAVTFLN